MNYVSWNYVSSVLYESTPFTNCKPTSRYYIGILMTYFRDENKYQDSRYSICRIIVTFCNHKNVPIGHASWTFDAKNECEWIKTTYTTTHVLGSKYDCKQHTT